MGIVGSPVTRRAGYYSRGAVMHLLRNWHHFAWTGRLAPIAHSIPTGYSDAPGKSAGVPECAPFEAATRMYADLESAWVRLPNAERELIEWHYRRGWTYERIREEKHWDNNRTAELLKSGRRMLYALMCQPRKGA